MVADFSVPMAHSIKLPPDSFPASGNRNNSNGSLNNVGSNGNYWSASANNTNNGRNLNFNSSNWNWNNNNRANGFSVRPVLSAFARRRPFLLSCQPPMVITEEQIRTDLYAAYFDARANKRNTLAQLNFEIFAEQQLEELYTALVRRTYQPKPAYCFITFDPVQREVYASQFRDRIIQHMLFNYLNPLFETIFIYDTYSCRKGKGTLFGVERYRHHLRSVTDNFREEAWVLYLDLSGYFMSIDKQLLIKTVMDEVCKHLFRKSPDGRLWTDIIDPCFVDYLLHCLLDRNSSEDCIRVGSPSDWQGLPKRKCLAYSPEGHGIVIGDITSQLFSNVLLNIYDQCTKRKLKIRHYGHYVDDMYHMHRSRSFLIDAKPRIEDFLLKEVHVYVHPDKWRLLSAYDANQYLGAYIRPYYIVPRQRTVDKFVKVMRELEYRLLFDDLNTDGLEGIRARINSYCGLLSHYKSFNLRKENLDRPAFYKYFTFAKGFSKAVLRPEYGGRPDYGPGNDRHLIEWLKAMDERKLDSDACISMD